MKYQIGVIGGGAVGSVLALGFARAGYRVELVDRNFAANIQHKRRFVLSLPTVRLLDSLGIKVERLPGAIAIKDIKLRRFATPCGFNFGRQHRHNDFFGFALDQSVLQQALNDRLQAVKEVSKVEASIDEITCNSSGRPVCEGIDTTGGYDLLAIADGSNSSSLSALAIETTSAHSGYNALVGRCHLDSAHKINSKLNLHCAYEVFDPVSRITLVLVPQDEGSYTSIVLSPMGKLTPNIDWLNARLSGWMKLADYTRLAEFPLVESVAQEVIRPRIAVFGNAACTMHPLAAQGLNLAYRQCQSFFHLLDDDKDPGNWSLLRAFEKNAVKQQSQVLTMVKALQQCTHNRGLLHLALAAVHLPIMGNLLVGFANAPAVAPRI